MNDDARLSSLLRRWQPPGATPAAEPRFAAGVWARIEARTQPATWRERLEFFVELHRWLTPAAGAAAVAAALVLGGTAGWQSARSARLAHAATAYAASIDPILMTAPGGAMDGSPHPSHQPQP